MRIGSVKNKVKAIRRELAEDDDVTFVVLEVKALNGGSDEG